MSPAMTRMTPIASKNLGGSGDCFTMAEPAEDLQNAIWRNPATARPAPISNAAVGGDVSAPAMATMFADAFARKRTLRSSGTPVGVRPLLEVPQDGRSADR